MTADRVGDDGVVEQVEVDPVFGEILYSYTRADALADGQQVDVSEIAKDAGIRWPVYLNRSVWSACVEVPEGVRGQDEKGRLWDMVWMLSTAILAQHRRGDAETILFSLLVRGRGGLRRVELKATAGARLLTVHDGEPSITVMFPEED